jgi:hypothetical protein
MEDEAMRNLKRLASIGCLLWLTSMPMSAQASAGGGDSSVAAQAKQMGAGTIIFDTSKDPINALFSDSHLEVHAGSMVGGHCTGELTLKHRPGELPVAAIELASNPTNCKQLVKVGHLIHKPSGSPFREPVRAQTLTATPGMRATSSGSATYTTQWQDPAGLALSQVWNHADWTYNGSAITSCSGWGDRWVYVPTGWYVYSYLTVIENGQYCNVYDYDDVRNYPFCQGVLTQIYYWHNHVYGWANGNSTGTVNTWSRGSSCHNWLHYVSWLY